MHHKYRSVLFVGLECGYDAENLRSVRHRHWSWQRQLKSTQSSRLPRSNLKLIAAVRLLAIFV